LNNQDNEIREIQLQIVRVEDKIDMILKLLEKQNGLLSDHEHRLRDLEKTKNKLLGMSFSALLSAVVAIIKSFLK